MSAESLVDELTDVAARGFSGVVVVHRHGEPVMGLASGLANRAEGLLIRLDTRLATASVTKGFTALTITSMIEEGRCRLDTRLTDLVAGDLPCVDPGVTIEHLLGHTSGAGDYLDEEQLGDIDEHVLDVPVHRLEGPEDYVPILNRHPHREPPGTEFRYNNGGFIMLALAIERLGDGSYHDEVRRRVFEPAAMASTDFLRSDRLPADTALGYLADGRTNVFHLPVIGTGDGGAYTTAPDMLRFWDALFAGRIVGRAMVDLMTTVRNQTGSGERYGLGFGLGRSGSGVHLEGMDAGVSMQSGADAAGGLVYCVIANNSSDAWPLAKVIDRHCA